MLWLERSSRCFTLRLTTTLLSSSSKSFATNFQCHFVKQSGRHTKLTNHKRQRQPNPFRITNKFHSTALAMSDQVKYLDTPDKPETDKKIYKCLLLANGLHALIVSDPSPMPHDGFTTSESSMGESEHKSGDTEETSSSTSDSSSSSSETGESDFDSDSELGDEKLAACAIMIDYGTFGEPRQYPGLAHFLEHMIFMGSLKYPEENLFDSHIKKCGGFSNAMTDSEDTTFYFEVAEKHLDSSLDCFSATIKHPLMKHESMQRERCAVDSEFQQVIQTDWARRQQLLASLATDGYPHGIFSWGNLKTLKDNVDDDELNNTIHEERRNHYAANRMYVCLQARLPIEDLEALVLRHFADIPSNKISAPDLTKFNYRDAFRPEFYDNVIFMRPVDNATIVELTWVLPPVRKYYRSKPDEFLSNLLGYEGRGSLCAYLRRRLWALKLLAGIDDNGFELNSMYSMLNVCIHLTDEGLKHLDDVLAATFAYIKVIAHSDPKDLRVIYAEQQGIAETGFRFQSQRAAMDNVQDLVTNFKYYPPKDVLTSTELFYEYNQEHLTELMTHLNDFKFNLMITTSKYKDVDYDKTEEWFGTEYASVPMPAKWKKLWNDADTKPTEELFLPEPNRFVAKDFTIFWHENGKPEIPEEPKKLLQNEICELWFRADDKYELPEAYMLFYFISPLQRKSPKNDAMCALYEELVKFHVSEDLYPATNASYGYTFGVREKGLCLQVQGYNEKIHLLVEAIAKAMITVASTLNDSMLDTFVKDQRKSYFNTLIKPSQLNRDVRLCVVEHMRWLMIDKYKSLNEVTLKDLQEFAREFPQQLYVQGLVQGNYTEKGAHDVMNSLLACLDCKPIQERCYIEDRTVQLPKGAHYIRCHALNEQDTNTVITNFYQIGRNTVRIECILDMLMMFVEEPLFNQLRTKEQLGYHVSATVRMNYGIAGYSIMVNSQETKTTASHVDKRIECFRTSMLQIIEDMSDEDYDHVRDSLIKLKLVADTALDTEISRNWSEIVNEEYVFDRRRQQIDVLRELKKSEIIAFLLNNELTNSKKLSVQVIGHQPTCRPMAIGDKLKLESTAVKGKPQVVENMDVDDEDNEDDDEEEEEEDDDELFEMLANKLNVVFLPADGSNDAIVNISEFKSTLDVYPMQSISVEEAKRPAQIEQDLMKT